MIFKVQKLSVYDSGHAHSAEHTTHSALCYGNYTWCFLSLDLSLALFFFFFFWFFFDCVWGWVDISSLQLIHFKFVKAAFIWNWEIAAAAAKSLQSCPTLCSHIDGSPPGSPIPGILQARTLEWVAISFSNAWKWKWSYSVVSDS